MRNLKNSEIHQILSWITLRVVRQPVCMRELMKLFLSSLAIGTLFISSIHAVRAPRKSTRRECLGHIKDWYCKTYHVSRSNVVDIYKRYVDRAEKLKEKCDEQRANIDALRTVWNSVQETHQKRLKKIRNWDKVQARMFKMNLYEREKYKQKEAAKIAETRELSKREKVPLQENLREVLSTTDLNSKFTCP
eukprot:Gregarina_sp_Poly_1__745@NODE_1179_length_4854_cov_304_497598_g809_i0_p2_GENE_NODE_1179_length_4854_cov_304_497598_g809_i0NODE_1179_length_4854_cov_304_497598_g809_i0_p2_ORF_typecomplete_len191_score14_23DUF5600/PF18150_1/0_03DUF5600/PF18150_1/1_1e03TAN/PF11640_8/1_4e04TAN/PF11640_8/0_054OmpH/PF03938_14/0_34DUF812/PF05667_11/0_37DUF1104/PF06518_11/1_7e03DUF1104/PF06518_11/1_2_NODE_1179_length_4854_cov_304_497598_g809_i041154687